jgi:(heptosyl)LPS beta-1,4-glucosyltransferase
MAGTLSAVVITKNEERHIGECLACLGWADELLVVDSFSVDRTTVNAETAGAKVYQRPFVSFPQQRNAALALAQADWVLFVDADERVTPELGAEVRQAISGSAEKVDSSVAGYWIPRRNIIWGRWIKHGGWYPDYQLRLLKRGRATYDERRQVHEVVVLDGDAAYLAECLVHYNYERLGQFFAKQAQYALLEAHSMLRAGVHPRPRNYVLQPLREMYRRYVQLRGYRDGWAGLLLAVLLGYYNLATYLTLRKLWRRPAEG